MKQHSTDLIRQQALSDVSQKPLALNSTYQGQLGGRGWHQSGAALSGCQDDSPLVLDTALAQTLMQSEVMVVQTDNIQDDSFTTLMQCRAIWKL